MENLSTIIKNLREENAIPLRRIASTTKIDQAILSKIENGQRKPTKEQVIKLAKYFKVNKEDFLVAWLSEKLVYQVEDEEIALKALQAAEEKVEYIAFKKIDRNALIKELKKTIKAFPSIEKAWVYGSFSRGNDGPKSDIDIAFKTDKKFSYFDLAEVQFQIEKKINRKVDVGFIDSFKPYIFENVKPDLKLIYERPA